MELYLTWVSRAQLQQHEAQHALISQGPQKPLADHAQPFSDADTAGI